MQSWLYIDKAHTELDIFRFAAFFFGVFMHIYTTLKMKKENQWFWKFRTGYGGGGLAQAVPLSLVQLSSSLFWILFSLPYLWLNAACSDLLLFLEQSTDVRNELLKAPQFPIFVGCAIAAVGWCPGLVLVIAAAFFTWWICWILLDSGHNCCLGSNGERIRQFLFSPGRSITARRQTNQGGTSWGWAGLWAELVLLLGGGGMIRFVFLLKQTGLSKATLEI